jgi:hypothetical protein
LFAARSQEHARIFTPHTTRVESEKQIFNQHGTNGHDSNNHNRNSNFTIMSPREREVFPHNDSYNSLEDAIGDDAVEVETVETKPPKKTVSFGAVQRREFNRIVGDHPDVKVGPPVSFDWEYGDLPSISLEEYESSRAAYKRLLRMSSITRKNMLRNVFEVDEEEIRSAEKEVQRIRLLREKSAKQSESAAVVESAMKRAGRKLRKGFIKSISASGRMLAASGSMPMSVHAY